MARKTIAKPKQTQASAEPVATPSHDQTDMMKKPDLLDAVVAKTNLKKRDVKPALEAAFAIMADALRDGQALNLPPLGKMRVIKSKEMEGGASVVTVKLRTPKNASVAATTGVAEADAAD